MRRTITNWLKVLLVAIVAFAAGWLWHQNMLEDREKYTLMKEEAAQLQLKLSNESACEHKSLALQAKRMREDLTLKKKERGVSLLQRILYEYSWEDIEPPILPPCLIDWFNPRQTVAGDFFMVAFRSAFF